MLGVTIAVVLVVGMGGVRGLDERAVPQPHVAADVAGVEPPLRPVQDELLSAGVRLRTGRLLAARTHRVLRADAFPPRVELNGRPVALTESVPVGSPLLVEPGRDEVEPLLRRVVRVPADTSGGLYRPGRPGLVVERVGAVSGELISTRTLRLAVRGPLRRPGTVLLTFDDGPDPVWTPRVLDLLRQHHVHAVFCLIGRDVRRHPDLVRRIVAEGHSLCDHTEGHDEHLPAERPTVLREQIVAGAEAIVAAVGVRPPWFRAPGGAWSPRVEQVASRNGMASLKWTVDPRDWELPRARDIVARVLTAARPGSVILLHDGGGDRNRTVAALRALLNLLPRNGLQIAEPLAP
jgi:peptidoglycan/xylan/chitin deacetylase (PgdA/CDA1 family)